MILDIALWNLNFKTGMTKKSHSFMSTVVTDSDIDA